MTREEAIEILEECWRYSETYKYTDAEIRESLDMAIKALEQEPVKNWKFYYDHGYTQAKRDLFCEDCISRADALKHSHIEYDDDGEGHRVVYFEDIENLPSVKPQKKIGRWIKTPKAVMGEGYMWYCNNCEHQVYQDGSKKYPSEKYCPKCGAEMKEVEGCR